MLAVAETSEQHEDKYFVKELVQRNAFFAHLDQLLLAMCTER